MRRRGFTMTELLVAAATLSVVLIATYSYLWQGFENGMDLLRRDTADSLSRNVLERYLRMPYEDLQHLFFGRDEIDVLDQDDEVFTAGLPMDPERLKEAGYEVRAGFVKIPGERPAALLRTRVSWLMPGGRRRSLSHSRYLVQHEGFSETLSAAPGFSASPTVPRDWGRATRWDPLPPKPQDDEARVEVGDRRLEGYFRNSPKRASRQAAGAAAHPANATKSGIVFRGDPALAAQLLGPGGQLARRHGSPKVLRRARARRAARRFLARTGGKRDPLKMEEIPDGDYRFRLEVEDRRTPGGEGRVLGVYMLESSLDTYHLVAEARHGGGAPAYQLEGDPVLERRQLATGSEESVLLQRTELRLYVFHFARDPFRRKVMIRTLETPDGSDEGTTRTRRQIEELLTPLRLRPAAARDELLEALPRELPPGGDLAAVPAESCRGGTCVLGSRTVPVVTRSRVRVTGWRKQPGAEMAKAPAEKPPEDGSWRVALELVEADPEQAVRLLDDYLMKHPRHAPARALRGKLFAYLGSDAQALSDLHEAAKDPDVEAQVLPALAALETRAGNLEEAEDLIGRIVALDPASPVVPTLQGAVGDMRDMLAQVAPDAPADTPAPAPPVLVGGSDTGVGRGASLSWDWGPHGSGSLSVKPPSR